MSEIILEFESFDLELDSNPPGGMFCRYDRLEIWDGFPDGKKGRKHPKKGRIWGKGTRILLQVSWYMHHFFKKIARKEEGKQTKTVTLFMQSSDEIFELKRQ